MGGYCAFIKENGEQCRARPLTGDADHFCISHSRDPKAMEIKAQGTRKGGLVRAKPDNIASWTPGPIDTMEDLKRGLSELFRAGMEGTVSTSRLSAIAAVANSLCKIIEGTDMEARIKALEELMEATREAERLGARA